MATELDKKIIRKMESSLQLYLIHSYPIEYMHEDHDEYSFSMFTVASPHTGKLLLTKMSKAGTSTALYRMDHECMQSPEDIVLEFQKEFREMYEDTARCYAEQCNQGRVIEV